MMYLRANKPSSVFADTHVGMKDGYYVFTTSALASYGLGFIIRWRVTDYSKISFGAWNSPGQGWPNDNPIPSVAGLEYWRLSGGFFGLRRTTYPSGYTQNLPILRGSHQSSLLSYGSWIARKNSASKYKYEKDGNWSFDYYPAQSYWAGYYPEIEVRYVKIYNTPQAQLDMLRQSINVDLVDVYPRPDALYTAPIRFLHNLSIQIAPSATCTTPSVAEGAVHFVAVNPGSFPSNQWGEVAYKDFTLTFSNCPRINVKYYVHANGNRWVDSTQGIVGVQGSVPSASDPVAGNPRGFAIQLQHRTGNHQHSGNIYIHPNEVSQPQVLSSAQSYIRNWQGAGASNGPSGVTHTIPMRARLVRTGSSSQQQIQFGPFNTSVIVAISYP